MNFAQPFSYLCVKGFEWAYTKPKWVVPRFSAVPCDFSHGTAFIFKKGAWHAAEGAVWLAGHYETDRRLFRLPRAHRRNGTFWHIGAEYCTWDFILCIRLFCRQKKGQALGRVCGRKSQTNLDSLFCVQFFGTGAESLRAGASPRGNH